MALWVFEIFVKQGYYGCAIGKGKQIAKNEIEKGNFGSLTVDEALPKVAKTLLLCHEEFREKRYENEISVISSSTGNKHVMLSKEQKDILLEAAQKEIDEAE